MVENHPHLAIRGLVLAVCLAALAGCGIWSPANDSSGASGTTPPASVAQPPEAPASLKGKAGNEQVSLTWAAITDAASYEIKRSIVNGGPYSQVASATSPSYTDSSVHNGTTYFYVVAAVNTVGESDDSPQTSVTPDPTITTPAIPMQLTAASGNEQVTLKWSASSGATSYHVKRSTVSGGPFTQISAPTSTSYTDSSLANGTAYYYVVSAVDSAGESANSAQAIATPVAPTAIPSAPVGVAATPGNAQVALSWSASSGATSYHVKRATTTGGPYTQVSAPTSTSYTDSSLSNGTKYYYVVSALDSAGESSNSAQVSGVPTAPTAPVSTPATPAGLSAAAGNAQVGLSWSASSSATSYHVKRATTSGGPYTQVGAPTSTAYSDSSLTNGTTYYYVVSALDSAGESANSSQASAMPVAAAVTTAAPTNLTASAGNAQVTLNWTASSGVTSYTVKRSTTSGSGYAQLDTQAAPPYTDNTASNGTIYYYVVDAVGPAGTSADSAEVAAGPSAPPPITVVGGCNGLPAVGVWQQVTPAAANVSGSFGMLSVSVDSSANVVIGTDGAGLFKSTDCGATFSKVNTGTLGASISTGGTTALIDPTNPKIMYTMSLFGAFGFFKSTDGGVNFTSMFPASVAASIPNGGFVGSYDMDPTNHLHLLVGFHAACSAPFNAECYVETHDGGVTWTVRNGVASWDGGEGVSLMFLDGNRWLFSSQTNGMWVSQDQGQTWTQTPGAQIAHGTGHLLRMADGSFFYTTANGVMFSPDGNNWSLIPNSGNLLQGIATDGSTVWVSQSFPYNPDQHPAPAQRYWSAPVSNHTTWTTVSGSPSTSSGGTWLSYDPANHILYSANYWDGLWRVVVK